MPETSATSQRTSANFPPASFSAGDVPNSQANGSTRIDVDVEMWRRLKLKGREDLPIPDWYPENEVRSNNSKIKCAKNDCTIKIAADNDAASIPIPIHAHSVAQLPAAEPSAGDRENLTRANLTYAAGQSPTEHNYKTMLIQGIESGLGTFQMVSTRAHRYGIDSKETPLINLLKAGLKDGSPPFYLSDRYQVTNLVKIAGDYYKSDDHVRYEMTVVDKQNRDKVITVPLTQAALPFTERVLQPDKIKHAHDLMQAHCDACADYAGADVRDLKWKNLMVLSHAGYGRNATVITYCRMAALAEQNTPAVDENNLCKKLEEAIRTGMASRDPNFVHSQPQMSALRKALDNLFSEKKLAARQMPRDDSAQRRRLNTRMGGDGVVMSSVAASIPAATVEPLPLEPVLAARTAAEPTSPPLSVPELRIAAPSEVALKAAPIIVKKPVLQAEDNEKHLQSSPERRQEVVEFFVGRLSFEGWDRKPVTIETVLEDKNFNFEKEHQFIQRLFPVDDKSKINQNAPVLNGADFLALRNIETVHNGLDRGFKRMLQFYGLKWDQNEVSVDEANPNQIDLRPDSHHDWRFTRIIRSLSLFGKHVEAKAFYDYLMKAVGDFKSAQTRTYWKNALSNPIKIPHPDPQPGYETYLFPNKVLSEEIDVEHRDTKRVDFRNNIGSVKKETFKKQANAYKAAQPTSRPDLPLKASFASEATVNSYAQKEFLNQPLPASTTSKIEIDPLFYFETDEMQPARPPDRSDHYDMYVDFANSALGGGWRRDPCNAQEEKAFIQNAGLGRVAHHPWLGSETLTYSVKANEKFGEAYMTRREDGTPSPIVIEGCELLDKMRPPLDRLQRRVVRSDTSKTTNWLAIAAPDYRDVISGDRLTKEQVKRKWQRVEDAVRKAAFTDLFTTAHAGFTMAKKFAGRKPLKIHSGRLGCGVFRNSWPLSAAAQLLAARVVGVQSIRLYDVRDEEEIRKIEQIITVCLEKPESNKTVGTVLEDVANIIAKDKTLS